jgi:hypothetical protein
MNTNIYNDLIYELPTDKIEPSQDELKIVNNLFKKNKKFMTRIANELKDPLLVGILYIIFSFSKIDELIQKFIPITNNSPYILLLIKTGILMIIYWFVKHFYLSRTD